MFCSPLCLQQPQSLWALVLPRSCTVCLHLSSRIFVPAAPFQRTLKRSATRSRRPAIRPTRSRRRLLPTHRKRRSPSVPSGSSRLSTSSAPQALYCLPSASSRGLDLHLEPTARGGVNRRWILSWRLPFGLSPFSLENSGSLFRVSMTLHSLPILVFQNPLFIS